MELFQDLNTAERIALGLLSFIALIFYLRWEGTWEDQKRTKSTKGLNQSGPAPPQHNKLKFHFRFAGYFLNPVK